METYTVTQAAKILNRTIKTLQYWDRKGILKAFRTKTNRRFYKKQQIENFQNMQADDTVDTTQILQDIKKQLERIQKDMQKLAYICLHTKQTSRTNLNLFIKTFLKELPSEVNIPTPESIQLWIDRQMEDFLKHP